MDSQIATVAAILLLVMTSAYFGATETAFTSFNRIRMKNMAADGDRKAALVLKLAENYDKLLSTLLIGNNIINIVIASLATLFFVGLLGERAGAVTSVVVVTLLLLIFAEISPKSIAREKPERFSRFAAPLLRVLMVALSPLSFLFACWRRVLSRMFKFDSEQSITEEELLTMVEEAETEGAIDTERSELIQNAIEFNDLEAWDVLTPRVDVVAVEAGTPGHEIAKVFAETGFSRLPVYEETIDRIIGVLNHKDFTNNVAGTDRGISGFVKPVAFMAGSVKIAAILRKMQRVKTHIAVIIDEYGGTEGIVTMEDIIEELVGEIYDEHDGMTAQEFRQLQDGSHRVLCSANLEKMFDYFGMKQEVQGVTTVNGWVVLCIDKLPEAGDSFTFQGLAVTVTAADEKKALEISVVVQAPEGEEEREL